MTIGYVNTPLNHSYYVEVSDGHQLYVEECGNPEGIPVLFLHGGPGGSVSDLSRKFFNPDIYRIILFDQRGTGQSKPFLSLKNNTVNHSVSDIEIIRNFLTFRAGLFLVGVTDLH
ncbi:alpha/beta fold hydrolase [Aerococcaceae bacterium WGS1372]